MIKLLDRNEIYVNDLVPTKHITTEILNGDHYVEMVIAGDIKIEKKYRILIFNEEQGIWNEFIVESVVENRTDGTKEIYAESSIYELINNFVEETYARNTTADVAIDRLLLNTRWETGRVDDLGISTVDFYRTNAKAGLNAILERWGAELRTRVDVGDDRILHRYVDLLSQRGEFIGEVFITHENINQFTREINTDQIVTALYGFGMGEDIQNEEGESTGGYGRRLDFGPINDGKKYLENTEARDIWGTINIDGSRNHLEARKDYDGIEDMGELKALTQKDLDIMSKPHITYTGDIEGARSRVGDSIVLIDTTMDPELRVSARIFEVATDPIEGTKQVVLGNYRLTQIDDILEQEKYLKEFRDRADIWDRAGFIDKEGNINGDYLENIIDELNAKMNDLGGYFYLTEGEGIITYNKPIDQNPTSAIQISGGAFRIANSRNAAGEWEWRTFGDGNGFVADTFIGGVLKGGKVKFDLTNGTLLIGNSIDDYSLFFDGAELKIKIGDETIEEYFETQIGTNAYAGDPALKKIMNDKNMIAREKYADYVETISYVEDITRQINADGIVTPEEEYRLGLLATMLADAEALANSTAAEAQAAAVTFKESRGNIINNLQGELDDIVNDEIEEVLKSVRQNQVVINTLSDRITQTITENAFNIYANGVREELGSFQQDFESTARKWDLNFRHSIGNNKIKNSIGFAGTKYWETYGDIKTEQSDELEAKGGGSAFIIKDRQELRQTINTTPNEWNTFSLLYKMEGKSTISTLEVNLINLNEGIYDTMYRERLTTYDDGDFVEYIFQFKALGKTTILEFKGLAGATKITNTLINDGEYKQAWSPFPQELYTTNVLTDTDGVKVKRIEEGREVGYTEQTPFSFGGVYDGVEVFRMDKDVFKMNKAKITKSAQVGNCLISAYGSKLNLSLVEGDD